MSDELGNMPLQIYNTLSGQKESFKPIQEGQASLYVCGPTVYGDSHLGHAKTYVSFYTDAYQHCYSALSALLRIQNILCAKHNRCRALDGR